MGAFSVLQFAVQVLNQNPNPEVDHLGQFWFYPKAVNFKC